MNRWLPSILIITVGLFMVIPAWFESSVYNEYGRLASGVIYLKTGDYSPFHVNPPLVNLVGAIPATLAGAIHATRADLGISSFGRDEYEAGNLFIKKNKNHRTLLFSGRLGCIVLVLTGLFGIFRFARTFYGNSAGYIFLGLCLFSPYILGFGPLVVPDVPSALFGAISVYFLWRWLRSPDIGNAFIAGLLLGIAELCKFTLLIFYPLYVIMWLIYRIPAKKAETNSEENLKTESQVPLFRQFLQLILIFAVSLSIINMGYFFEGTGKPLRSFQFQTIMFTGYKTHKEIPSGGGNRFDGSGNVVETVLGYLPIPLPANFVQGIDTQRFDFERGLPSYLRGEWSDHGWWYFYLYALLIKTPLGTIGIFLLAIYCTFFLKGYNSRFRDELVILLPGVAILVFVSSQTGFSIHSRYVIPALPFFFIWTSKVGRSFDTNVQKLNPRSTIYIRIMCIVFSIWSIGSSIVIYPYSISYFNELAAVLPTPEDVNYPKPMETPRSFWCQAKYIPNAGPRNGPRHLLDSNIDWGQDLFRLERWCKKHPEIRKIKVAYWRSYPLDLTKIPLNGPPPENNPQPGWYAVSVNHIYDREKRYRYFLYFEPYATIGYSIYIYHITLKQVNDAYSHK